MGQIISFSWFFGGVLIDASTSEGMLSLTVHYASNKANAITVKNIK